MVFEARLLQDGRRRFMQEYLFSIIEGYPYLAVGSIFVLCGIGLPLPEEVILIIAGYTCFGDENTEPIANIAPMMASCAIGMAIGDLIPYQLGRLFGVRLLRLRPLRILFTKQRLARFDDWFRQRGDLVIFFARFLAGIRTVAFFTAGTMKMPLHRFMLLDGAGILLLVPPLTLAGLYFGETIDDVITWVKRAERSVLIAVTLLGAGIGTWYWARRHRKLLAEAADKPSLTDSYIEPKTPVRRRSAAINGLAEEASPRPLETDPRPNPAAQDKPTEGREGAEPRS